MSNLPGQLHRPLVSGEVFEHYKGARYSIVCEAVEEDTGIPVVIYKQFYPIDRCLKPGFWSRKRDVFLGPVTIDIEIKPADAELGTPAVTDQVTVARFVPCPPLRPQSGQGRLVALEEGQPWTGGGDSDCFWATALEESGIWAGWRNRPDWATHVLCFDK